MTVCANCNTTQGPFERARMGKPLCKKDFEGCKKRRDRLDRERWDLNKGEARIKDE